MEPTSSAPGDPALIPAAPAPLRLSDALRFWWKLGCISFGGPAGQIALMHEELVERRRWISEKRFLHALNYCMLLPGPEAQQLATYIGWLLHRTWGGLLAGTLFVLPSLVLMIGLSWLYMAQGDVPLVAGVFYGIKPAVTALVVQAAWRVGSRTLHNRWLWAIAVAAFVALLAFGLPFPLIVLAAALAGHLGGRYVPQAFAGQAVHAHAAAQPAAPALIDDATPTPAHARFFWQRCRRVLVVGAGLWLAALGGLWALGGWHGALTQMGWFFTKAALMTFGGAYAVLPYVYQGAVEHYHWLGAAQMMDGLALGESTPGPLIMVVAFVAFVGGWGQALFGPEALWLAGAAAAVVVTFFTFLPSFVFILVGGPFIESTHGQLRFTAPLTGITAAVVGVIANLAVFFACHVLWPHGPGGGFDALAAGIGLLAAVALMRLRWGVVPVLALCGALGAAVRLSGL